MGPEAEKIRMAGNFTLEKSKPKTMVVEQVNQKVHLQSKKKNRCKGGGGLIQLNSDSNGKERCT